MNKKILLLIVCILVLALGGIVLYGMFQNPLIIGNKQATPDEQTLYVAKKGNEAVLFYRYPDLMLNDKMPPRTLGHVATYEKPYDLKRDPNMFVDYKDLQHPKKLFSFEGHAGIENYVLSEDKNYLLLSLIGGKDDSFNYIYQINLQNNTSKKIWENKLRSGKPPYNGGIAYVTNLIPNKYMVFAIIKSAPPPDTLPEGVIIKNIQSGKETLLGVVGDITIDSSKKTVSYKQLQKTPVPCEKNDPICFATDTYKYAYRPGGEPVTKPLP